MLMKRVVVTGMAGISPIGNDWQQVSRRLKTQSTGTQYVQDWEKYKGLNTRLGAPADFSKPEHYSRKQTRGMGRIALMATYATELALTALCLP
jgi:3-oxoacyl-[acyl-carrier-protein] synthase II